MIHYLTPNVSPNNRPSDLEQRVNTSAHPDADLSLGQLTELVNRLISMRSELVGILNALDQQVVVKDDCSVADAADAAGLQETRLRANSIAAQHRQTIMEIDLALGRLKSGHYGVSEASGDPIPFERLLLIPWARTGANE